MIAESDWKKFKKIKEKALEKFCGEALYDFEEAITDKKATNHGKYLHLYKLVENYDKNLGNIFNGNSRSKAHLQLTLMRSEGLVEDEDLLNLSGDFQELTKPNR